MELKSKAQLDAMSSEEIDEYRYTLLKDNSFAQGTPLYQYYKELEFYKAIRFKQDIYDRYDRWEKESKGKTDLDSRAKSLILKVGKDNCYYLGLANDLKEIVKFQYILGIQYVIPEELVDFFEKIRTNEK